MVECQEPVTLCKSDMKDTIVLNMIVSMIWPRCALCELNKSILDVSVPEWHLKLPITSHHHGTILCAAALSLIETKLGRRATEVCFAVPKHSWPGMDMIASQSAEITFAFGTLLVCDDDKPSPEMPCTIR